MLQLLFLHWLRCLAFISIQVCWKCNHVLFRTTRIPRVARLETPMLRFTRPTSIVLLSLNIVFISLQDALDVRYLNQLTDTASDHQAFVPVIQYKKGTILSLILYMWVNFIFHRLQSYIKLCNTRRRKKKLGPVYAKVLLKYTRNWIFLINCNAREG